MSAGFPPPPRPISTGPRQAPAWRCSTKVTNISTWNLEEALGIDNNGDIVGEGVNPSGQLDAFLLTPTVTPEPSTLLLAASGLVGLLAYAWRKRK